MRRARAAALLESLALVVAAALLAPRVARAQDADEPWPEPRVSHHVRIELDPGVAVSELDAGYTYSHGHGRRAVPVYTVTDRCVRFPCEFSSGARGTDLTIDGEGVRSRFRLNFGAPDLLLTLHAPSPLRYVGVTVGVLGALALASAIPLALVSGALAPQGVCQGRESSPACAASNDTGIASGIAAGGGLALVLSGVGLWALSEHMRVGVEPDRSNRYEHTPVLHWVDLVMAPRRGGAMVTATIAF